MAMSSTRRGLFRGLLGAALLAVTAKVMPWEAEAADAPEPVAYEGAAYRVTTYVHGEPADGDVITWSLYTVVNIGGQELRLRDNEQAVYRSGRWVVEGRGDA
jgi:hypothetical protein